MSDSLHRLLTLASAQHGAFHRRQAIACGIERRRMRRLIDSGTFVPLGESTYLVAGHPISWLTRLCAATLAASPGQAVASHRAAARLHGLDVDRAPIELTLPYRQRREVADAIVHVSTRLDRRDIAVVDGVRTLNVAATLCGLGAVADRQIVERALDAALRRGANLTWIRSTLERLDRPGPSGTATLRAVLNDPLRTGRVPESWFERVTQRLLHVRGLPQPVAQYEIRDERGRLVARVDFAYPSHRVAVECHGWRFHGAARAMRDLARDRELTRLGWEVVYVTWEMTPAEVVGIVRDVLAHRAVA